MSRETTECRIRELEKLIDIQGTHGNWDYDEYMHGMYNGMIFGLSVFDDKEPDFRGAPDAFLNIKNKEEKHKKLLETYPSLKEAYEHYLIILKLVDSSPK